MIVLYASAVLPLIEFVPYNCILIGWAPFQIEYQNSSRWEKMLIIFIEMTSTESDPQSIKKV